MPPIFTSRPTHTFSLCKLILKEAHRYLKKIEKNVKENKVDKSEHIRMMGDVPLWPTYAIIVVEYAKDVLKVLDKSEKQIQEILDLDEEGVRKELVKLEDADLNENLVDSLSEMLIVVRHEIKDHEVKHNRSLNYCIPPLLYNMAEDDGMSEEECDDYSSDQRAKEEAWLIVSDNFWDTEEHELWINDCL